MYSFVRCYASLIRFGSMSKSLSESSIAGFDIEKRLVMHKNMSKNITIFFNV